MSSIAIEGGKNKKGDGGVEKTLNFLIQNFGPVLSLQLACELDH